MREVDRFVHLKSIEDLKFVKIINEDYRLIINYTVKDKDLKNVYQFEVENFLLANSDWIGFQSPILKLISPALTPNLDVHLLRDNSICYTFPGDLRFDQGLTCGYAIEQSFKWAFGYEFYLTKFNWPFLEMPHGIYPNQWGFYRPTLVA